MRAWRHQEDSSLVAFDGYPSWQRELTAAKSSPAGQASRRRSTGVQSKVVKPAAALISHLQPDTGCFE